LFVKVTEVFAENVEELFFEEEVFDGFGDECVVRTGWEEGVVLLFLGEGVDGCDEECDDEIDHFEEVDEGEGLVEADLVECGGFMEGGG
jgi:hypothetical protein